MWSRWEYNLLWNFNIWFINVFFFILGPQDAVINGVDGYHTEMELDRTSTSAMSEMQVSWPSHDWSALLAYFWSNFNALFRREKHYVIYLAACLVTYCTFSFFLFFLQLFFSFRCVHARQVWVVLTRIVRLVPLFLVLLCFFRCLSILPHLKQL
jgi:hypothetical protein